MLLRCRPLATSCVRSTEQSHAGREFAFSPSGPTGHGTMPPAETAAAGSPRTHPPPSTRRSTSRPAISLRRRNRHPDPRPTSLDLLPPRSRCCPGSQGRRRREHGNWRRGLRLRGLLQRRVGRRDGRLPQLPRPLLRHWVPGLNGGGSLVGPRRPPWRGRTGDTVCGADATRPAGRLSLRPPRRGTGIEPRPRR